MALANIVTVKIINLSIYYILDELHGFAHIPKRKSYQE